MEAKTEKNTPSKKFSFRKLKNSKGKKESQQQPPVELESEQTTVVENSEPERSSFNAEVHTPEVIAQEENETVTSGEAESPNTKIEETPSSENSLKKKSKRRSLFRRSSKKTSEKVDGCELEDQGIDASAETKEDTFVDAKSSVYGEQVTSEGNPCEITDQSDNEGYLTAEQSEAEGETSEGEALTPEGKEEPTNKGTKRKGFFKRGISLKRRKNKKQTSDARDDTATTKQDETESASTKESTAVEIVEEDSKVNKAETDNNEVEETNNDSTTEEAKVVKLPVKPPRKVSFAAPDGTKLESSDEGDSPTEEAGDESDEDTVTAEDVPSEVLKVATPQIVVISEDVAGSETVTEGEDDDLTEVSSMSSSLLASSSDAPDTIFTSDYSKLFVFTDTDDSGSRITLEGISEESEAEFLLKVLSDKREVVSEKSNVVGEKSEVVGEESEPINEKSEVVGEKSEAVGEAKPTVGSESYSKSDELESRPGNRDKKEDTKLLGDSEQWEMVNTSYDMSMGLSRVRKQTLFGMKRLCCSVM